MIRYWCRACNKFCDSDPKEVHEPHKEKVIGIRADILIDALNKLCWELKITDRLVPWKP